MQPAERFSEPTRRWFMDSFPEPTEAQQRGWDAIATGGHTLIHAPTGSGKTLAAFLWAIDGLANEAIPDAGKRCRVLYISPMKALAYDVDRNLRVPLAGIQAEAERIGLALSPISTAMRTGDTPQTERRAMLRTPPDILITTPESLYLMLTSQMRSALASVRTVIVDEVHSVAGTKRGSHLSISLERLTAIAEIPPQRIGLSATQRPLEAIGEYLGGGETEDGGWAPRPVAIVDAPRDKNLDLEIVVPVPDLTRPEAGLTPHADEPPTRSIWPAVYPQLHQLLIDHHSTIFFVNSRSLAERLAGELNRLAGEEVVRSHHGSVSREQRTDIEERLKNGALRGVVATSTLELGIDMAAVDLVVLVESPPSVASGLQRVGRAGHQVGATSVAKVFPKHRGDLLEAAVVVDRIYKGAIESTHIPQSPLDVLAQQIVAIAADATIPEDTLFGLIRRASPYRDLTRPVFESVLDMLAGRYPSDEFAELRPRIVWDRVAETVSGRSNARILAVTNPGTIPDRGLYRVTLPDGTRVGELDEEMVFESRAGDRFVLGSSTWRVDQITRDRVVVTPAPGSGAGKMPFWHGDRAGRPLELGRAIGAFTRRISGLERTEATEVLESEYHLDAWAAQNLTAFIGDERDATGTVPSDRTIVVERFRDEIGDWRVALLSPFGARVHAPWALAARRRYRDSRHSDLDVIWADDGILFRFPDADEPPATSHLLLDPEDLDALLLSELADSALFAATFREAASRSLLLPRARPGTRTPLWLQRRKAANLLEVAQGFGSFPIVLETYREILKDHFDVPALKEVLGDIEQRRTTLVELDLPAPSPFATSLTFDFVASFMYDYDAPVAERRAAALSLDRALLADLLGEPEFRDLLDAGSIHEVEQDLQRVTPDRRARSADAVHDLLLHLGPLDVEELRKRVDNPDGLDDHLEGLMASTRIAMVRVGDSRRYAAVEDLSRLRDALGIAPPRETPEALLVSVDDPTGDVVGRYARTHGPFTVAEAAAALNLPDAVILEILARLEVAGRVALGGYRPGGTDAEWIDTNVLRRVRRASLARLRSEVEAVEPRGLARFLPRWQAAGPSSPRGTTNPLDVVERLAGARLIASSLETDVLVDRGVTSGLDELLASGEAVWIGRGPIGDRDGSLALYPRASVPLLHWARPADTPDGPIHEAIRTRLGEGASFFADLYAAAGGGDPSEILSALWDLVWAGEVTNDTLAPVRAFISGGISRRRTRKPVMSAATPPAGAGRWYAVSDLHRTTPTAEESATAIANTLLDRHGVVGRDTVLAEGVPGGFAGLYPVLAALEDIGAARRGYFVEGLGGAQFGIPGAIDRLRSRDATGLFPLAASDPANAYGAAVPWPDHPTARPVRRAGAYVVIDDGSLIAYVDRSGRSVASFTDDGAVFARGLALLGPRIKHWTVERIDGVTAADAAYRPDLVDVGFVMGYKGLTLRTTRA
ncbi:MAG: DEAD/DEAH box helicase [Acidimicrobiia bacterium]